MNLARAARTSIGAKSVMAVSGLLLILFLLAHMLGNLQIFFGPELINAYGHKLRAIPGMLWVARIGLLTLLLLHVDAAVRVTRQNRRARPEKYEVQKAQTANVAARTLMWSGILIFAYVVYHLLHFTTHSLHAGYIKPLDAHGYFDVFSMVVGSFQNPFIAWAYILAMLMLFSHLSHGIASFLQTLGISHPRYTTSGLRFIGPVVAALIVVGFIAVPLSVQLGLVKMTTGGG